MRLISLACLVISLFLVLHYLRPWRRREVPYRAIVWLLAGFFLLCAVIVLPEGHRRQPGQSR